MANVSVIAATTGRRRWRAYIIGTSRNGTHIAYHGDTGWATGLFSRSVERDGGGARICFEVGVVGRTSLGYPAEYP
jgi:hypothetical protein